MITPLQFINRRGVQKPIHFNDRRQSARRLLNQEVNINRRQVEKRHLERKSLTA
jgi:hypothetical protein